jgi:hypothetical protein
MFKNNFNTNDKKLIVRSHLYSYIERGWAAFPLHHIMNGKCSCGKPSCKGAGKHPVTKNGLRNATSDKAVIDGWISKYPYANWGIRRSGLISQCIGKRHPTGIRKRLGDRSLRYEIPNIFDKPIEVEK